MAFTVPRTWTVSEIVTAAMMNTDVRDNIGDLDARTTLQSAGVATAQTTTSTSYTDLATVGPAITKTTGTLVLVAITAGLANSSATQQTLVGIAITGATTVSPSDSTAMIFRSGATPNDMAASYIALFTVNAGSNTFTLKYRVSGGTGTFSNRGIVCWPAGKLA